MLEPQNLRDLIAQSDSWLTSRIILYAKERGFTPFTSTLEQAWLASIRGLSALLIAASDEGRLVSAVVAETNYECDPIALYGIEAAKRHRSRGVTLGLFLGLMKSYRQTYVDLVTGEQAPAADRRQNREIVDCFFDRMEVGFCDEWSGRPADEQFEQLRHKTQQLTNEKNKYLTIFESLKDPVILVDENGRVENVNYSALKLFGGEAAPGASYYSGVQIPTDAILGDGLLDSGDTSCERLLSTSIGPRWFDIKTQRMLDVSEKYLGAVVIMSDVTEYRSAREEAERADRAKSAFLATMSHEIRTPIHGILGLAELLRQRRLDPEQRKYVNAIARSGELLSSVVSDVLDYSKIEAGSLDLEQTEFSVSSVHESVFELMLPLVDRKPELRLVVETPTIPTMVGDPGKLRQILLNLVGNAVKFTERGVIKLSVSEIEGQGHRPMLRFEVSDTGIGIPQDRLAAIFDPFTQSDASVGRRFGGSGLGLAICHRLVDRLGGTIGVESRLGEGSLFWFTSPLQRGAIAKPATSSDAFGNDTERPFSLDLLVVEDNEVNAMVASGLLERAGHRVVIAPTGAETLALFETRDFDVVLMDLRLPDIDGLEITRRMRGTPDAAKRRTPIIALSAQALAGDIEACTAAGVNDFIGKPFKIERLQAALRRVAASASSRPSSRRPIAPIEPPPAFVNGPASPLEEPVDEAVLAEHIELLGLEQATRIVATFEESVAKIPGEIERLASSGQRQALADLAHRLKSSSMHVGLARLSDRAGALELLARSEKPDIVEPALDLAAACRGALVSLNRSFARMSKGQPANT